MTDKETLELAQGLQYSNFKEVASLAKSLLLLNQKYEVLLNKYIIACGENVMNEHSELLKRLTDGDIE